MRAADLISEMIEIPMGPRGRATIKCPSILYHSLRGRKLGLDGSILPYKLSDRESELASMFDGDSAAGFIWLAQTPNYGGETLRIDANKLDPRNLRWTGQAEGFILHRGAIPADAIFKNT